MAPIVREPIENGAILVRGSVIGDVGPFNDISSKHPGPPVEDLGEVILLPGLINAHCHLDYTHMAGKIPPPSNFPDWIKSILALKAHWSYSEYAASWVAGANQLLESGTTTVADIEAAPELLPEVWNATPLRVISQLEMTGVRSGHQPERLLNETLARARGLPASELHHVGLSPHALYSTPPELLRLAARTPLPTSVHIAESAEEWEMYQNASGPLYDWLKTQRDMSDCGGRSPIQQLQRLGMLRPDVLLIHANHLGAGDAELIANSGATVVHCPKSHAYFKHAPFQFDRLRNAGVNICLGTDSLASTHHTRKEPARLNLWDELRLFAAKHPNLDAPNLLELVTINPARALSLSAGAITPGRFADLIAVAASSLEEVFNAPSPIKTMVAGRWNS